MPYENWLVVGGNRGIGLGLVKEIIASSDSDRVIATVRNPTWADELQAFAKEHEGRVMIIKADFNDEANSADTVAEIKKYTQSLDHVIINAGIAESRQPVESLSAKDFERHFAVNVAASHTAIKALYPFVEESTADHRGISFMSTAAGSIGILKSTSSRLAKLFDLDYHPLGAYAVSKAALNMLGRFWAIQLESRGIAVALIHPGTVKTDAIDVPGAISTGESAEGLIKIVRNITVDNTAAGILAYDGKVLPW